MPKGLKPVRRTLATGETRLYWYHRATGQRLEHDPATADGLLEIRRLDGLAEPKASPARSLAALWDIYRQSEEWRALKPRTRSDYQKVRDWIGDAAKAVLVIDISTADVLSLRDKAAGKHGRRFGNYVVQVLRMLFEWGRLRNWLKGRDGTHAPNPAMGKLALRRPKDARTVNRAWTTAEVRAFMAAAPEQILVPFTLGLFAGMRQGDALIVTWASYNGHRIDWTAGKNGEDCSAPVTGVFKRTLDAAKARRSRAVQIAVNSTKEPWTQSGFRASFFKLVRKLTAAGHMQPGCTFHGLRHTIAAGAREDGESNARVAAAIGDRSSAMADIYARDADRSAAQMAILGDHQKRYRNIERKTDRKTGRK